MERKRGRLPKFWKPWRNVVAPPAPADIFLTPPKRTWRTMFWSSSKRMKSYIDDRIYVLSLWRDDGLKLDQAVWESSEKGIERLDKMKTEIDSLKGILNRYRDGSCKSDALSAEAEAKWKT